jgi:hypothetical protein
MEIKRAVYFEHDAKLEATYILLKTYNLIKVYRMVVILKTYL